MINNESHTIKDAKRQYSVKDIKKYMCTDESSYKDVSVEDYIKKFK